MNKSVIALLCALFSTLSWAQTKEAYVLYNAQGERVEYGDMLKDLAGQDVVFFGEIHTCPIAHWMEVELTRDLYAVHKDRFMLGAEMFERDDQVLLNEYLGGLIDKRNFSLETKLWDNYDTDYAPLVEIAKANHIPFVATNVARRYANMVSKGGLEALDKVSEEGKQFMAPLPFNYKPNKYVQAFFANMMKSMPMMKGMPGKKYDGMASHKEDYLCKSQALKDVTMAYSIAQRLGYHKMLHFNGSFHSTRHDGIIPYLNDFKPGLKIGTVEVVRQPDVTRLDPESIGAADYILCVPASMTSTKHN